MSNSPTSGNTAPQTVLRFCHLPIAYHVGALNLAGGTISRRGTKHCDFELGLLSISLDPPAWVQRSSFSNPTTYEITADRVMVLLDVDYAVTTYPQEIQAEGVANSLIHWNNGILEGTGSLFKALDLTPHTLPHGGPYGSPVSDMWLLQMCLAVLATADKAIDGLWWSDLQQSGFPSERGGLYQHRLPLFQAKPTTNPGQVVPPPCTMAPVSFLP